MKYLVINSVAGSGSTGKIAAEKCRELQKKGHQCILAYGRRRANCDDIETLRIGTPFDYMLHGMKTRMLDQHGFGSKKATQRFLTWVKQYDPDIIWLHNIHGYYINIEMLFDYLKKANKKVYWTLHDCWGFTGHCAFFSYCGCDKWTTGCYHCAQKDRYPKSMFLDNSVRNYKRKKAIFQGIKDLTIITPSQWLAGLVRESFLKEYQVEVVKNEIDRNIFKPTESDFKERYGLQSKRLLLGVANVWEERKGLFDYFKLAEMMPDDIRIILVGLNKNQMKKLPHNVIGISRTENIKELAEIYTAADVFVNLSYEENYPTVNLEAQACGTPVIAYDAGGTKESIEAGSQSNLAPVGGLTDIMVRIEEELKRQRKDKG